MKKYKVVENLEREQIWADLNLSGSKFKNWCLDPEKFIKNEQPEFSDFVKEKLASGHRMEPVIFEWLKDLGLKLELDKNTFQRTDFEKCFANIDGKCWITEKEWIPIEIKNSEAEIGACIDTYKYQLAYYCWFFGVKKIMFAVLTKGWKLRYKLIEFEDVYIEFVDSFVKSFHDFLKNGELPDPDGFEFYSNLRSKDGEIMETIEAYEKLIDDYKSLETKIKSLKEDIRRDILNKNEPIAGERFIYNIKTFKKKAWNMKNVENFIVSNGKNPDDFKDETEQERFEIKEKK